jgi:hypothetical protein
MADPVACPHIIDNPPLAKLDKLAALLRLVFTERKHTLHLMSALVHLIVLEIGTK